MSFILRPPPTPPRCADVLKQQGHFYDLRCVAHSPNGQLMATGSDDAKVKVWNASTGFCFVTFAEHTAPVTAVAFVGGRAGRGLAVLSASLDGSVRAFDLVRYRNFRTLTPPEPAQVGRASCVGRTSGDPAHAPRHRRLRVAADVPRV